LPNARFEVGNELEGIRCDMLICEFLHHSSDLHHLKNVEVTTITAAARAITKWGAHIVVAGIMIVVVCS
jgi:hypothetical protein